jgi:hypothetical protein
MNGVEQHRSGYNCLKNSMLVRLGNITFWNPRHVQNLQTRRTDTSKTKVSIVQDADACWSNYFQRWETLHRVADAEFEEK